METIRNIFCVGRNYRLHAEELGNAVPTVPMLFGKPTHSLTLTNGQTIELPGNRGEVHYEAELVIHIARPFSEGASLEEMIDKIALGIDFTLRDVQSELKKNSHPWLLAKGFRHSAVITPFQPFPGLAVCEQTDFSLNINGEQAQRGNIRNMIFDLMTIIRYTHEHFGLGAGDIIFTGTPEGVGPTKNGDHFSLLWGDQIWGEFTATFS
ncbi:fumarylacetoacetate hydrolase family protein [Brevibacillus composti]|uniref:Fumarylacetoacetate hydrolase family protein n=1 Tax=Brevibacillus composti TaxID=2796470 RepID=A0A7T5EPP9_9BACL|nr:fumarylacetoacetate hydrolase family protein [Brevibacillus composti]QQE76422.1 fumarylacetoacetate hydrolase family protein [Brevibacillus composti]QUO43500.1 fumarylacetoacetate hydrolase family protein [Brevibacillus composti]